MYSSTSTSLSSSQRYDPFGMVLVGRNWQAGSADGYSFGFNGKMKDDDISGNGNIYDYGFRIYNPRLGKFLSTDPYFNKFPYYSPYQFSGNMPIIASDMDGLEPEVLIDEFGYITDPVADLLSAAFNFGDYGLYFTKWTDASKFKGENWKMASYAIAQVSQGINAITLGEDILFDPVLADVTSLRFWIILISHEHTHREDNAVLGPATFNAIYLANADKYEERAYANDALMAKLLNQNPNLISILESTTLTYEEQKMQLTKIGLTFRLNEIINPKIDQLQKNLTKIDSEIQNYKNQLESKSIFRNPMLYSAVKRELDNLITNKKEILDEIGDLNKEKSQTENKLKNL